jgi:putative ABC transport system substrate-binding protein
MKRRDAMTGAAALAGAAFITQLGSAQSVPKALRVGIVSLANERNAMPFTAIEGRFHELGYVEGRNFTLDFTNLKGRADGFGEAMKTLVARKANVLVAFGPEVALKAAMAATSEIPIVMVAIDYDPLTLGYVKSLSRPDGNITGVFLQQIELAEKRLELLKETLPDLKAATMFWDGPSASQWQASQKLAPSLGLDLAGVEFTATPYDYDAALAKAPADHRRVLVVCNSPVLFRDRIPLAQFALRNHMASIFAWREWVEDGGLLSYGPSFAEIARRTADYVDRLARGARPADLPIEQPTHFELVVNLKTAKALGLTIPPAILARADEVIE